MTRAPRLPRLRQVAIVARDLDATTAELQKTFGWDEPFHDPGVGEFGLVNSVFAAGDCFVEVVSPAEEDTAAGRYLEQRGGDSGYMALFQVPDIGEARTRVEANGIRVVWKADLPDIAGTHLHPKDIPGAIVSLDWADPPESWRWGGPAWVGAAPDHRAGGLLGLTIEVKDHVLAAQRWASALGLSATSKDGQSLVRLQSAGQELRFVPLAGGAEGIVEVSLGCDTNESADIAGVHFACTEVSHDDD